MKPFFVLLALLPLFSFARAQEKLPTRKHFWHTVETTADPQKIWQLWTQVAGWHTWDTGLQAAHLPEPFGLNAQGTITSREGRQSRFRIVAFEAGRSYTFRTRLPLGALFVKRSWQEQEGKIYFTHEVWFSGLSGGLFARQLGGQFRAMLPEVMHTVKQLAEQK